MLTQAKLQQHENSVQ